MQCPLDSLLALRHPVNATARRHAAPAAIATALRSALVAAAAAATLSAHAGRPMATDDADVVEAGACQLEVWTERARDSRGLWLNPGCNPFGSTEISLGGARISEDGEGRFNLLAWQVKQLLRPFADDQPGFAVALGGERARRTDERSLFLTGIATVPLAGEERLLHLNLGMLREREDGRSRHRALWGVAFDAEMAADLRASIEGFGVSGERAHWQAGLAYGLLPGRLQLDASVGSGVGRWRESRVFTLGFVVFTDAFLR